MYDVFSKYNLSIKNKNKKHIEAWLPLYGATLVSVGHVWAFGSSSILKPSGAAFNKGSLECLLSVCIYVFIFTLSKGQKERVTDRQTEPDKQTVKGICFSS